MSVPPQGSDAWLPLAPFHHVGILVEHLDAAIERFSSVMGLTFRPPRTVNVDVMEEHGRDGQVATRNAEVLLTYSNEGPPHIELIQMQGTGIYSPEYGEGLHHVGVWTENAPAYHEELMARGLVPETVEFTNENRFILTYFYPDELHGTRVEIIDMSRRPGHDAWMAGGAAPTAATAQ